MALPLKFTDLIMKVVPDNESDAHIYRFLHVDQCSINLTGYLSNKMTGLLAPDVTIILPPVY